MNRCLRINSMRFAWMLAALCALAFASACAICPLAMAAEQPAAPYVDGVSYNYDSDDAVATKPNDIAWDIAVGFSENIAVPLEGADDSFIQRNMDRVHLYTTDGGEVKGWHASVQGGGKRVIYIELDQWLKPLTEYQVVVDAGIEAAERDAASMREYRETFKTGSMCPDGLTIYQNIWIALGVVLVLIGVAVQVVRVKKRRR